MYICEKLRAMQEDFRLRVFVTVAEMKSFSKAAELLHISQPAVSQHISELERQLGVKLFERQRGMTALTPAGEVFDRHAREILSGYARIQIMYALHQERVVKVSASEEVYDYMMSELLADFIAVHPEIIFAKSFPDDADIQVNLLLAYEKRGTFALGFSPSESFAVSRLWKVLSQILEPALK